MGLSTKALTAIPAEVPMTQKARMTCGSLHYDACYTRDNGKSQLTRSGSCNWMAKSHSHLHQRDDWRWNSNPAGEYCTVAWWQEPVWIHAGGGRGDFSGAVLR